MLSDNNDVDEIVKFIKDKRHTKMADEQINFLLNDKFNNDSHLDFEKCNWIDNILYPELHQRGYWREAYDFPQNGDTIYVPMCGGPDKKFIVKDSGFFCFNVEDNPEIRSSSDHKIK